jgi:2-polyprenyl-6-methoxyphenol hydroxylase-like FAD-dependent oxidoreductase
MKVLIAGAGIGGLTAALSLNAHGVEVCVFESAAEIKPLGVGINLLPNAVRELCELGLQPELDKIAIRTRAMNYYNRRGKLVISSPCGEYAGYRWPQYSLHRGELQLMLLRVLRERAGDDAVHCGHRLADFEQDETGVRADFADPLGDQSLDSARGDVLVGADGIHSTVRAKLLPGEGQPVYSGLVSFRGSVVADPYLDGETMIIVGDVDRKLVSYPISETLRQQGKSLINWLVPLPEEHAPEEDWMLEGDYARFASLYRDWRFDWLDVPKILEQTGNIFEFPLQDRDPLSCWTFGRVTMLGDAAHPLIPVSSSGAVQAIIDGRALAFALACSDDPVIGLKAYEIDRIEKANRLVRSSRKNGPDEVLELARRRCPDDAENIHDHVTHEELQQVLDGFKEAAGLTIDTLNNLPSYNLSYRDSA